MTQSYEEKSVLNCIGKSAVLSELLKRNLDAYMTIPQSVTTELQKNGEFRITRGMQLFVKYSDGSYKSIKVKTSREKKFITNYYQTYSDPAKDHPDYWIIVRIDENNNFHYYILTHDELGSIHREVKGLETGYPLGPNDLCGVDKVRLRHIAEYEDMWDTIENRR